jgi:tRNA(Ile)-lysidine synthase TilS/MesJ
MYKRPAELPNFESLARKYRFQTLGRACKEAGINSLFLAHHEDDQAETVMMRLIHGHGMLGLTGMKKESEIPECRGLHGVSESGGLDDLSTDASQPGQPPLVKPGVLPPNSNSIHPPMATENGGIRVYRPLLGFSKERLIATCQAENMTWFEDHTNQDPTVTKRNAIRSMFRSHKMPAALTTPSLVRLLKSAQDKMERLESIADVFLEEEGLCNFDTRTGTFKIRFPHLWKHQLPQELIKERGSIAAVILRRVLMLVTPEEHIQLSSLHSTVQKLFPEVEGTTLPAETFTVSGLQISPAKSSGHTKREWRISRQKPPSISSRIPNVNFLPGDPSIDSGWSEWELYDGRYWIRIQNHGTLPVLIRPFHKQDLVRLKAEVKHPLRKKLEVLLKKHSPGNVRWTLPTIVIKGGVEGERVLALPTLNFGFPYHGMPVKWEVRYKKVDLGKVCVTSMTHFRALK